MTIPPTPPPDHEEHVEVVRTPAEYQQRHVVRNTAAEQRQTLSRITQVIWLLFGFLEALLALRLILKLVGANPAAFFTQVVYGTTSVFLWPFTGILPDPAAGAFQLEISTIVAMIVYALIAWGITKLIWVLFYHPDTTAATTYTERRY